MDLKQSIKPTGPLGSRLLDKALMYKSMSMYAPVVIVSILIPFPWNFWIIFISYETISWLIDLFSEHPVCFGFPELKGSSRRDYWLDICLEILLTHKFIRKYNLKGNQHREALSRASLGILRYRAIRECFHLFTTSSYKTLLCFNLAENLPGGDVVLDTLFSQCTSNENKHTMSSSPSLLTLHRLGILSFKEAADVNGEEVSCKAGCVCVGEINPLETVVKQSIQDSGRAEAAQASISKVKVDGIDTNFAVSKVISLIFCPNYLRKLFNIQISYIWYWKLWFIFHNMLLFWLIRSCLVLWLIHFNCFNYWYLGTSLGNLYCFWF